MTFLSFFNADCDGSRFETFGKLQTKWENEILRSDEKPHSKILALNYASLIPGFHALACFECSQGKDCSSRCFDADACVKVTIGSKVTKGCYYYDDGVDERALVSSSCGQTQILYDRALICYCRDLDYCNKGHHEKY
uniref:Uncharacterized protein n=1 Tax=Romanomermis culicivorax TaxID=13658 RepID=A0A915JRZ4_ROMCU